MKSIRWKKLLKLNEDMMNYETKKLEKITNLDTHVIKGSYSVNAESVSVYAMPKENRWFD